MSNQLQTLAAQLRCPDGEIGVKLGHTMNMSNLSIILHSLNHLYIQAHDNLLEIGYGNGGLLGYILSLAKHLHYTGVEISDTMHQEAQAQNQPYIAAQLAHYQLYDGTHLPFDEPVFDKIFSVNTIYFWQQPVALLASICQVLKRDGHLCLTFCDKSFMQTLPFTQYGFRLYDVDDVKQLAQTLPLKLINEAHQSDTCISKSGALVERKFISLVFKRITLGD